jgi:hypothetical protein
MAINISDKQSKQIDFLIQQDVTEVGLGYRGLIAKIDGFYQRNNRITTKLLDINDFTYAPLKSIINETDFFIGVDKQKNIINRLSINSIEEYFKDKYSNAVIQTQLIGEINNINKIFSTPMPYISGTISVYWNGIKERHFKEISNTQIELEVAPLNNEFLDYLETIFTKQ